MTVHPSTSDLADRDLSADPTGSSSTSVGSVDDLVHLRRGGTSVVVRVGPDTLPSIVHWGRPVDAADTESLLAALALPPSDSVVTTQEQVPLLPLHGAGWLGRPGLLGHRAGRDWSPAFRAVQHRVLSRADAADGGLGGIVLESEGTDTVGHLAVRTELELLPSGVMRVRAAVRNTGTEPFELTHLEPAIPVPAQAAELLDFTGRHTGERHAQRRPFDIGAWVRESWGGRPGHDAATLLCAGTPGFGYRSRAGVGRPRRVPPATRSSTPSAR